MRTITKGSEPPSLTAHRLGLRLGLHCDYDNYTDKTTLRNALVAEQRGLCCYCMRPIRATSMKIEHWHCQRHYSAEQLHYRNLLGACLGGEGQPPRRQHCDTRKGDRDLRWNPADPDHQVEARICYKADGSIGSNEEAFDAELNEVLNLNVAFLRNGRKAVQNAVLEWWRHERSRRRGPVPRNRFERERDRQMGDTGELRPYCQVAIWWIDQRLDRMQA